VAKTQRKPGARRDRSERAKAIIGMVHVPALPGTPGWKGRGGAALGAALDRLVSRCVQDAQTLRDAGFDALIVENMHDAPYVHGEHGPETVAIMTRVMLTLRRAVGPMPIGVQVLSGGNWEAIAICAAAGAHSAGGSGPDFSWLSAGLGFIRCENFVFGHVADEGILTRAEAGRLLRYRRTIDADGGRGGGGVRVFCDIQKKHASHAITGDLSIADIAEGAEFFGADGLIVTGAATGKSTSIEDVREVRGVTRLPLLVGSGVTERDGAALLEIADGLIVGSSIKVGGSWRNPVDAQRARRLVRAVRGR
jgi:predicted TIM-barrel enzyme